MNNCESLKQREINKVGSWCNCEKEGICIGCCIDKLVENNFGEYGYGHLKTHTCREIKKMEEGRKMNDGRCLRINREIKVFSGMMEIASSEKFINREEVEEKLIPNCAVLIEHLSKDIFNKCTNLDLKKKRLSDREIESEKKKINNDSLSIALLTLRMCALIQKY